MSVLALGTVAAAEGQPERVLRLTAAGVVLRRAIQQPLSPDEQWRVDDALAPARAALDLRRPTETGPMARR